MAKWRRHNVEFKRQAVERMGSSDYIQKLADELQVERRLLYTWKNQLEGCPEPRQANLALEPAAREAGKLREENQRLKEALGEKTLEVDFFRSALRRIDRKSTRLN